MKSYVIRIDKHEDGQAVGRLINTSNGKETHFSTGAELLRTLGIKYLSDKEKAFRLKVLKKISDEKHNIKNRT